MKGKLMIVDDEKDVREMIRSHFELRQYKVFTAQDGQEGLQIAEQEKPQLVMMDIKMPRLDGDEMLARLHHVLPKTAKFIVVTAYNDQRIKDRVAKIGCDAYFEKPVSISELQKKVEELLKASN